MSSWPRFMNVDVGRHLSAPGQVWYVHRVAPAFLTIRYHKSYKRWCPWWMRRRVVATRNRPKDLSTPRFNPLGVGGSVGRLETNFLLGSLGKRVDHSIRRNISKSHWSIPGASWSDTNQYNFGSSTPFLPLSSSSRFGSVWRA